MACIGSNNSFTTDIRNGWGSVSRLVTTIRREISGRLLERRIYVGIMRELWDMPDAYRLELGIDPYEYERFARAKARRESGRSAPAW